MKYHEKKCCKFVAIFMVLAMLIATPLGTGQIYAEDGGGADTTSPLFTAGYPREGSPQKDGSRQVSVVINSQEEAYHYFVLLPDGATAPSKEQVVAGQDGDGNNALKSGKYNNKTSSIDRGIIVPLHNTSYDVYIVLEDDAGNLSDPAKVDINSPSAADFFVTGFPQIGEVQPDGSEQVKVKVKLQNINIERKGKVYWVLLPNGAVIPSIEQIASGTDGNDSPAISSGSSEFSLGTEGSFLVTGSEGETDYDLYMVVGHTYYANPLTECTDVIKLDVKTPSNIVEKVCAIDSTEYSTLLEAFEAVKTGETIKLLQDISYTKSVDYDGAISINGKKITFDLNGHNLSISNPTYSGIDLSNRAEMNVTGGGTLNINSRFAALNISYSKFISDGSVEVFLESQLNSGISAESFSTINIAKGTIKGAVGIYAVTNNNINVAGPVIANGTSENHGIALSGLENTVKVESIEVLSGSGSGIYMEDGGSVTVGTEDNTGFVIGRGNGITTRQGSKRAYVTVYGDVEGGAHGIYATDDAEIKVFGNVISTSTNKGIYSVKSFAGITSSQSNLIEIYGNVDGINGVYVGGAFGNIKVTGNVTATGTDTIENCGVYASYGSVEIGGNVNALNCIGANTSENGQITIDGTLIGKVYVIVYYVQKTVDDKTLPTTKEGYHTYSEKSAIVWVKEDVPIVDYTLTVQNGTGSGNYIQGTKVNISADVALEGQVFSHWTTSNGGSFQDVNSATTTFTMPENSVTIKANYKASDIPSIKYIITASAGVGGSISPNGSIDVEENSSQTFVIIPNNNYKISSVVVDGVEQGLIPTYTFNNVTTCHAITALFDITTSSGIKSNSSSGPSTIVIIKPDKKPDQPLIAATTINPKLDKNGSAIVTVSHNVMKDVIKKAYLEAEKQNRAENGIGVCLETKNPKDMKSFNLVLTQPTLKLLIDSKVQEFELECGLLNLNFDLEALREIRKQSNSDVTINITKNTELTKTEIELMEVRTAYDISLSYINNGDDLNISELNNGNVRLSIPYTSDKNEAVGYLFGIKADGKGSVNRIFSSIYDVNNKKVIIDSNIVATYGVGYTAPSARFTDISEHWAKENIDYIVGRDLFKGTADNTFSPDLIISRGMMVTVLGRLTEANVSIYNTSSFTDVANDMYYMPYIEWAYMNGIVNGVDGNKFEPDRGMTREEVALVLQNYAKTINFNLPVLHDIIVFADKDNISDYAKDAVNIIQQAGIIMGDQNNKFNPKNAVSRGEAAAMLQRYVKLTIDPATAKGWAKHDDGQWFYYKDSKNLTGWQDINDKRYYFNDNGSLQIGWVKDYNNWLYIEK